MTKSFDITIDDIVRDEARMLAKTKNPNNVVDVTKPGLDDIPSNPNPHGLNIELTIEEIEKSEKYIASKQYAFERLNHYDAFEEMELEERVELMSEKNFKALCQMTHDVKDNWKDEVNEKITKIESREKATITNVKENYIKAKKRALEVDEGDYEIRNVINKSNKYTSIKSNKYTLVVFDTYFGEEFKNHIKTALGDHTLTIKDEDGVEEEVSYFDHYYNTLLTTIIHINSYISIFHRYTGIESRLLHVDRFIRDTNILGLRSNNKGTRDSKASKIFKEILNDNILIKAIFTKESIKAYRNGESDHLILRSQYDIGLKKKDFDLPKLWSILPASENIKPGTIDLGKGKSRMMRQRGVAYVPVRIKKTKGETDFDIMRNIIIKVCAYHMSSKQQILNEKMQNPDEEFNYDVTSTRSHKKIADLIGLERREVTRILKDLPKAMKTVMINDEDANNAKFMFDQQRNSYVSSGMDGKEDHTYFYKVRSVDDLVGKYDATIYIGTNNYTMNYIFDTEYYDQDDVNKENLKGKISYRNDRKSKIALTKRGIITDKNHKGAGQLEPVNCYIAKREGFRVISDITDKAYVSFINTFSSKISSILAGQLLDTEDLALEKKSLDDVNKFQTYIITYSNNNYTYYPLEILSVINALNYVDVNDRPLIEHITKAIDPQFNKYNNVTLHQIQHYIREIIFAYGRYRNTKISPKTHELLLRLNNLIKVVNDFNKDHDLIDANIKAGTLDPKKVKTLGKCITMHDLVFKIELLDIELPALKWFNNNVVDEYNEAKYEKSYYMYSKSLNAKGLKKDDSQDWYDPITGEIVEYNVKKKRVAAM